MDRDIKGKIIGGMKWAGIESFAGKFISIITSVIIARQLMPSDYGIIGMIAIFIAISNTFLNSGVSSALVQKKDTNQDDFSTGFFINVVIGITVSAILYLCAPLIADYYNQPLLIPVTRTITISLLINSLCIVQTAKLTIKLDFKRKAKCSLYSQLISGATGIFMAYSGYGVWALIIPGILAAFVNMILLYNANKWFPSFTFSKKSFDSIFGFGSKHLLASIIYDIYTNFSTFVIGKLYNAKDLGYYTRASQFSAIPNGTILGIIIKVNYPVLTKYQDDNEKLLSVYSTMLRIPIFVLFPLLMGMGSLSEPMIEILLGYKWLPCAGMLTVLCFAELWNPLILINTNLLYVKGRTDIVLKLEMIKRPLAILMILCAVPIGVYGVCWALVLFGIISFFIDTYYSGVILNYGAIKQLKQILPILMYSVIMFAIVYITTLSLPFSWLKLLIGIPLGIISYILSAKLNHDKTLLSIAYNLEQNPKFSWIAQILK